MHDTNIVETKTLETTTETTISVNPEALRDLTVKVTHLLHRVGMPSHLSGFRFVRTAIIMVANDETLAKNMTKVLYPQIAAMYKTTSGSVERAIRHAIEVAWNRGDFEYLEKLFQYSVSNERGRATNVEFIATLADWLRLGSPIL